MDDERKRILGMLARGAISVEECEELLRALSDRTTEKLEREVRAAKANRPVWPFVLLIALAIVGLFMWGFTNRFFIFSFPGRIGLISLLVMAFWIWMIVDCLSRPPSGFRLLFSTRHEYDKWIWCGILFLSGWVGAIAYFIIIRRAAEMPGRPTAESPRGGTTTKKPEEPFIPSPPARSLWPFMGTGLIVAVLACALLLVPGFIEALRPTKVGFYRAGPWVGLGLSIVLPAIVLGVWMFIFWLWMLIDCLARDYREFGTLVTTNKSVDKILWLVLIWLTFAIGALAYHISVRKRPRPVIPAAAA